MLNCSVFNFVVPIVNEILSADLSSTTGVLTKTNDEALKITGQLLKNGIPAKQSSKSSDNLPELHFEK